MRINEGSFDEERRSAIDNLRQWRASMNDKRFGFGAKQPKTPPPPTMEPRLSDQASSIGQRILDLEDTLTRSLANGEELTRGLIVEQRDNDRLREEIAKLMHENQRLLKITSQLEGMFTSAAKIILEANTVLDRDVRGAVAAPYVPKPDALRNMARTLMPATVDDGQQIPEYLVRKEPEEEKPGT